MKTLTKIVLAGASTLALTAGGATVATAKITPGLYNAGNIQEICLESSGAWYSPTFSGWGGVWSTEAYTGETATLVGNYASGFGNDSMVIHRTALLWNEWNDSLSFVNLLGNLTFTRLSSSCGAPHAGGNKHANPMQGQ